MSVLGDIVGEVVDGVLKEILKKTRTGTKRTRRRKATLSPTERLKKIEKLLKGDTAKPAKKQTSRRRTAQSRSKAKRRSA